jgi:sarcosine oxidase subunit gamma
VTAESTTTIPSLEVLEPLREGPARHLTELMEGAAVTGPRGATLHEHEFAVQLGLRAEPGSESAQALEQVLGVPLPTAHGQVTGDLDGLHVLRLAPDEFLAVDVSRRQEPGVATPYQEALEGIPGQAVDLSANRTVLVLEGPGAREVLEKSVALDLHPRVFGVGRAEATLLSTVPVVLVRSGEESWRILPRASFADHMVRWLVDGMTELGSASPEQESAERSVRPAQFA